MKKVYCVCVSRPSVPNSIAEICASYEVAQKHAKQSCYDLMKESGFVVSIIERLVWDE